MPVDYSAEAVSRRLRQVDDLRRTCRTLAARHTPSTVRESPGSYGAPKSADKKSKIHE